MSHLLSELDSNVEVVGVERFDTARETSTNSSTDLIILDLNCLTSAPLGHLSLFLNGGFGSSRFDVKPLVVDGSSGGF